MLYFVVKCSTQLIYMKKKIINWLIDWLEFLALSHLLIILFSVSLSLSLSIFSCTSYFNHLSFIMKPIGKRVRNTKPISESSLYYIKLSMTKFSDFTPNTHNREIYMYNTNIYSKITNEYGDWTWTHYTEIALQ